MRRMQYVDYMADFETTVYEGQDMTEVWAAALIALDAPTHPDSVEVVNSMDAFMNLLFNSEEPCNKKVYFHNLKFDGTFIVSWLYERGFKIWSFGDGDREKLNDSKRLYTMPAKYFTCMIGDMGQWYTITVHYKHQYIQFSDSLKLLPFSVEDIGAGFNTAFQKLEIEYTGKRSAGGLITPEEIEYIKNDVLVVHEALNKLFEMTGEEKMTIGSLCLSEFYKLTFHDKQEQEAMLPDLSKIYCPVDGFKNTDEYIRKSYHGGWCYVKSGCENKLYTQGCTADVNSLYPSMMSSESGNAYAYGKPKWFKGNIPDEVIQGSKDKKLYYYVRVRCQFYLKENMLPTIQLKGNPLYPARKWLESSDINGMSVYRDFDGSIRRASVEMVLSQTDFDLIKDHYNLVELEILDGCYFRAMVGLFDEYINKWAAVKLNNKGAIRTLAKLFLNNLYGKMASSTDSSYIIPFMEDGVLHNKVVVEYAKSAGYIAIGAAVTSYARNFTIRHAQENYTTFLYADTDSIHCCCAPEDLIDIKQHDTAFQCWKIENEWDAGVYVRAKTYIEHTIVKDGEKCDPFYLIRCAGMGKNCKAVLNQFLLDGKMKITDFKQGLIVPHNLKAKRIKGGTVLVDREYKLR